MVYSSSSKRTKKGKENLAAMRFQERDGEILKSIHDYDGVLTRRQIKRMFWPDKSWRVMDQRLSKLVHNQYIARPDQQTRRTKPVPEPVVWLDWQGAYFVAESEGVKIDPPKKANENQMRLFQRRLGAQNFHWLREPRWIQLTHDLAVVDFRLTIERSLAEIPHLSLERWENESLFRANPDVIQYKVAGRGASMKTRKKGVIPDGFFVIVDEHRKARGGAFKARFLVELDMATHDNPSFGIEKAAAGAAYISSPKFKDRFGANAGRWLVITTGEVRMKNMMVQTKEKAKAEARLFFFTTFDLLKKGNVFTSPVWWQVEDAKPKSLIDQ